MTQEVTTESMIAEADALLVEGADPAELLLMAQDAAEPGEQVGDVVHRPDENAPYGMTLADVQSAGWKKVWHVVTHEESVVNGNMLASQIEKTIIVTDPDGTKRRIRAFTTIPPKEKPARGTLKCILHEEHPDRAHHLQLGLPTCPKDNIVNAFNVILHARHRHKQEWETIEEDRRLRVEGEERELRELNIAALRKSVEPEVQVSGSAIKCGACSWYTDAPKANTRKTKWYKHMAEEHPGVTLNWSEISA